MIGMTGELADHTIVNVDLGQRSYSIRIGDGLIARTGPLIAAGLPQKRVFILTDENVAPLYLDALAASLETAGIAHDSLVLPPGEATKSFAYLETVLSTMYERGCERRTTLLALGGGVVGDLGGFAAASYMRGIDFIQIPTTLLAQVDSSVGGKTGINLARGKNLVGAFYQPRAVVIDTQALDTLPRRQFLAGYAEVAKYGALGDDVFWTWLEVNGPRMDSADAALRNSVRAQAIRVSCEAKAKIVAADEREGGSRALLNLGHTFGHALEAETGFSDRLLHGEAVAVGMVLAFRLSERQGLCDPGEANRIAAHLREMGLPTGMSDIDWPDGRPPRAETLIDHMRRDKKVVDGSIGFVLARAIGVATQVRDVPEPALVALLEDALADAG